MAQSGLMLFSSLTFDKTPFLTSYCSAAGRALHHLVMTAADSATICCSGRGDTSSLGRCSAPAPSGPLGYTSMSAGFPVPDSAPAKFWFLLLHWAQSGVVQAQKWHLCLQASLRFSLNEAAISQVPSDKQDRCLAGTSALLAGKISGAPGSIHAFLLATAAQLLQVLPAGSVALCRPRLTQLNPH